MGRGDGAVRWRSAGVRPPQQPLGEEGPGQARDPERPGEQVAERIGELLDEPPRPRARHAESGLDALDVVRRRLGRDRDQKPLPPELLDHGEVPDAREPIARGRAALPAQTPGRRHHRRPGQVQPSSSKVADARQHQDAADARDGFRGEPVESTQLAHGRAEAAGDCGEGVAPAYLIAPDRFTGVSDLNQHQRERNGARDTE